LIIVDNHLYLSFDPHQLDPANLTTGVRSILLTHPGGENSAIDPTQTALKIQREHPAVERMEADLGAICEVFKQSSSYYLTLPGVPLAPGDRLTLTYHGRPLTAVLSVIELEGQRARIAPPVLTG
jgi:hypothetical protein